MNYITGAQLAENPGARELAEVATATHLSLVDSALMELTLRGESRADYSAEDIAVADDALARIVAEMEKAESIIDGFLAQRSYTLPLSPVPALVSGWTRDIGRYTLHKDRLSSEGTDPILRAYRDAMKFLAMVADGTFSLGADDPIINDPQRIDVEFTGDTPAFSRRELNSFR